MIKPTQPNRTMQLSTGITNMSTIVPSLSSLLSRHDVDFIECAYQTLLGRAPDPEGLNYYVGQLRTGISKMQILTALHFSNEGKSQPLSILGLEKAIKLHRMGQYPIIGGIFRWINKTEGKSPIECKLRALENQIFLIRHDNLRQLNQIEEKLSALCDSSVNKLGSSESSDKVKDFQNFDSSISNQKILSEQLKQISSRARHIYFQLKAVATDQAEG